MNMNMILQTNKFNFKKINVAVSLIFIDILEVYAFDVVICCYEAYFLNSSPLQLCDLYSAHTRCVPASIGKAETPLRQ